jgi:hypothetical protein
MHLGERAGLELIQALVAGRISRTSIMDTIPMSFDEARKGYVRFNARPPASGVARCGSTRAPATGI